MTKSEKEENLALLWAAVMIAAFLASVWFDKLTGFSRLLALYKPLLAQFLPYALWSAAGAVALYMVYLGASRQTQDQDSRAIRLGLIALLLLAISDFHSGPDLPWVIVLFVAQSLIPALQAAFQSAAKNQREACTIAHREVVMSKSEKNAGLLILKIVGYIAAVSGLTWLVDQPGPSQFLTKHLATALMIAALGVTALGLFLSLRRQIEDQDSRSLSLGIFALFFLSQSSFRTEPIIGLLMAWLVFSLELIPALRAAFKSPLKTKEKPDYPLPNRELFSGPQS